MNLLVALAGTIGGFCGLCGIPALFFLVRNSIRETRALRDKPLLNRIDELKADLGKAETDADFWRGKYLELLQSRGGGS